MFQDPTSVFYAVCVAWLCLGALALAIQCVFLDRVEESVPGWRTCDDPAACTLIVISGPAMPAAWTVMLFGYLMHRLRGRSATLSQWFSHRMP